MADATQRGANGHVDPADADTIKLGPMDWPPPRRRWWGAKVTSRPARAAVREAEERRPVPAWVPSLIAMLGLAFVTNLGVFMYWKGQVDKDLLQVAKVEKLRLEVAYLRGVVADRDDLTTYVQMLTAYEINLREKILPFAERYRIQLPPFPERPQPRRRSHPMPANEEDP